MSDIMQQQQLRMCITWTLHIFLTVSWKNQSCVAPHCIVILIFLHVLEAFIHILVAIFYNFLI